MSEKIYLVLENGKIFEGKAFGAKGDSVGELVFTTNVVGFVEALSDPCYKGQILVQTFPTIGNYGTNSADMVSDKCHVSGYVVKSFCDLPSNFRCEKTIDEFLKEQGVIGICGVDTRQITRIIRDGGVQKAYITDDLSKIGALKKQPFNDDVASVSIKEVETYNVNGRKNVAVIDLGNYKQLVKSLNEKGINATCYPFNFKATDILNGNFDGVVLSEGPSNPAENEKIVSEVKSLLGHKKVFGIGLGGQILAIANNCKTFKLKYGHRGGSQPVKDMLNGKVLMTSQNHGYAIDGATIPADAKVIYENLNDMSVEGVEFNNGIAIQFNPIGCEGPEGCVNVFDAFISNL